MVKEEEILIADRIETILKEYGEAIKLSELVSMTEGQFDWPKNTSRIMKTVMELKPEIQKASHRFGFYVWVEPSKKITDEEIIQIKEEDKKMLQSFHSYLQPVRINQKSKYKIGDYLKGKVTGIETYGAFVQDEDGIAGLVHHTAVRKGRYVTDCNQYFKFGDEVTAKIKIIKPDGKMSLDTTESLLPDYFNVNTMQEKMAPISPIIKAKAIPQPEIQQIAPMKKEIVKTERSKEFEHLIKHIQDIVGVVSEPAKDKLEELITNYGLVKFMLTMTEVEKDFKVDLGLKFLEEVKDKMGNHL